MGASLGYVGSPELTANFDGIVFGVLTAQVYSYYRTFPDDRFLIKAMVGVFWTVYLAILVSMWHGLYLVTVLGVKKHEDSQKPITLYGLPSVLHSFFGPFVQAFLTNRIRRFSGTFWLPLGCWILSAIYFALILSLGAGSLVTKTMTQWRETYFFVYLAALALGAFIDVTITAVTCYHLMSRRKSVFKRTTKLVDKIMIWSLSTGLVTSVLAVLALIIFLAAYDSFVWVVFGSMSLRSFPITFLATLHARLGLNTLAMEPWSSVELNRSELGFA